MAEQIILHEVGKDALYKIWHASKEHLFMYIYSDGGSIVTAEKIFPMKHGTLVFIAAGTYHYTMPDDPATYDRSKLLISPEKLDKAVAMLKEHNDKATIITTPWDDISGEQIVQIGTLVEAKKKLIIK